VNDFEAKRIASAQAIAALHGIVAEPSRDDRGRATLILTRDNWTREILPTELGAALEELRTLERVA
jgi:hypothetical protein